MSKQPERRLIDIRAVENTDNKMLIEGYAITFDQPATHDYGGYKFTETIKQGALDKTDMKDVPLRYNHNDNVMIKKRARLFFNFFFMTHSPYIRFFYF
jgi:phage head maturation protease